MDPRFDFAQDRPQAILRAAVETLQAHRSVAAKMRQQIDLFDRDLVGSGEYYQQRSGGDLLIRLELRIQVGDSPSSLLQVLSPPGPGGHYLWTYRRLPDEEKLSRVDVARVAAALEQPGGLTGRGADDPLPGIGGLPGLLRALQAAFAFDSAELGQYGGLPVWRLRGHWRPERLVEILPDQKAAIEAGSPPDLSRLPEHLPHQVVLLLGQEDLFPYRIEYRRQSPEQPDHAEGSRAVVTMELFEVALNAPIDPARFIYNPGDIADVDETDQFIESLAAPR